MQEAPRIHRNEKSLRELLDRYIRNWYWFILFAILGLLIAKVYLRYATPSYLSKTEVLIKDDKSGNGADELAAFSGMGWLSRFQKSKIENEIAIFKSKRIIRNVVEELKLNVQYDNIGTIKTSEIYDYRPFEVNYLSINDSTEQVPRLNFQVIDEARFELSIGDKSEAVTHNFGEQVQLPFGNITVVPNLDELDKFENFKTRRVQVIYRNIEKVTASYQGRLQVVNEIPTSNVVIIRMQSAVPGKTEDFLNELVFQYNKDAISDRNQVARRTSDFIDDRLRIITKELDSVETNKEVFKSENRLTNIEAQAQLVMENASEFQKRQFNVNTQLELANTMIDYMERSSSNDLLPANLGIEGQEVSQSISNYNNLILQRNRLLKTSTSKNPVVINLNNQITDIRKSILSTLKNTTEGLKLSLRDLNYQESALNSRLSRVPTQEKIYRGIERQQTIKEQLYLFLLQQREEASISLAVTSPKAKVVDKAYTSNAPVSPKRSIIYLGALMAGLLLPFIVIYSKSLLNNKILSRSDLEQRLTKISLVGEIPKLRKDDEHLIKLNDRSVLAESFRILRTNLQYLFINKLEKEQKTNTVFVTSTVKGEGKTFVAFNLALTIALTGKKVVLVGADIRNPQLHRYIPKEEQHFKGLTEFIIDPSMQLKDITAHSAENENLSIILSGAIPPNPAELLMEDRTKEFFQDLRSHYDYVIVDTAPSMLVTDTILINHMADVTLYVFRAGYTEKKLLDFVCDALDDGRLSNVAGVLNNVSMNNFGYGNKYGYAYHQETTPWHKRLFKR